MHALIVLEPREHSDLSKRKIVAHIGCGDGQCDRRDNDASEKEH
jgi:hypothetical protein